MDIILNIIQVWILVLIWNKLDELVKEAKKQF